MSRKVGLRSVAVGVALGIAVGLLLTPCCIGVLRWAPAVTWGDRIPALTQAEFDAAEARWAASRPQDYDLDVVLSGSQTGQIHVEVRQGKVTAMTRNGVAPKQRRTWDVWTVPGQFDMIRAELAIASDPEAEFAGAKGSDLVLRGSFDPKYGYPLKYQRIVMGTSTEIRWEIVRFQDVRAVEVRGNEPIPPVR